MTERQLQFRVGSFVLFSLAVGALLIVQFGSLTELWQETYPLAIVFPEVPGLQPGCPVKQTGITIGRVREISINENQGGVLVIVDIKGEHRIRMDAKARVARSLFGDSKVEFTAGESTQHIPPRSRLIGQAPNDPM